MTRSTVWVCGEKRKERLDSYRKKRFQTLWRAYAATEASSKWVAIYREFGDAYEDGRCR